MDADIPQQPQTPEPTTPGREITSPPAMPEPQTPGPEVAPPQPDTVPNP